MSDRETSFFLCLLRRYPGVVRRPTGRKFWGDFTSLRAGQRRDAADLDSLPPAAQGPRPVILVILGTLGRRSGRQRRRGLRARPADAGYLAFSIAYRLKPQLDPDRNR
jgi:hypothetical protein